MTRTAKTKPKKKSAKSGTKETAITIARRKRPIRKHVHALFSVHAEKKTKKDMLVFSDNISMGGVFLETFEPLPPGTKVVMHFPIRSVLKPIEVRGVVAWNRRDSMKSKLGHKSPGMAVAFEPLKKSHQKFLKEFLDNTLSYGWFLE